MKKKILYSILLVLLLCPLLYAGTSIEGGVVGVFRRITLTVLPSSASFLKVGTDGAVTYDNSSYLSTPASPEQGDVLYYNGTSWVKLAHGNSGQYLKTQGHGANVTWGDVSLATRGTFVDGNLTAGVLNLTHGKDLAAPYSILIQFFDNNGKSVVPDIDSAAANYTLYNFTGFGTLSGTWGYVYL